MGKLVFGIQYILMVVFIILISFKAPGVWSIAILSWAIPMIYFIISGVKSIFKKDKLNVIFSLLGFFLSYCISVKFIFIYHNIILQILVIFFAIFFVKKFELKHIQKNKLWFVLTLFLINVFLVFTSDTWIYKKLFNDDTRKVFDGKAVTWDMFQEVDSLKNGYDADINSVINYKVNDFYNFNPAIVLAVMKKNESHVVVKGDDLLIHEDYHFKITEVSVRKLRKELFRHPFSSYKNTTKIIDKYIEALEKTQKEYDNETSHGVNKQKQLNWQKLVDKELQK